MDYQQSYSLPLDVDTPTVLSLQHQHRSTVFMGMNLLTIRTTFIFMDGRWMIT